MKTMVWLLFASAATAATPPVLPTPPFPPRAAGPSYCGTCKDPKACEVSRCTAGCENGHCFVAEWVALPSGDFALLADGRQLGNYRVGVGYRELRGDSWGPVGAPPVAFVAPRAAPVYAPTFAPMRFAPANCGPSG